MSEPAEITYHEAVRRALDEAMAIDPEVFVFGEDVGEGQGGSVFGVAAGLGPKYGEHRVLSTPIAEQAIVGLAIGSAVAGMRPVAEVMLMNFTTVAMDQIVNHAAKTRYMSGGQASVPLTIRTATGAGGSFGAQHSDMLEAWFAHTAGLKVVMANDPGDVKGLLLGCIFDDDPCIFVEHTQMYFLPDTGVDLGHGVTIPLGLARVRRTGDDVTVIGYGKPVRDIDAVAEELAAEGISVEVIDLRTVSPLDMDMVLASVARTKRAVVVHESVGPFGVGAEVSSRIHEALFGELTAPVQRVASTFTPIPFAPALEKAWLYSQADIAAAIRRVVR
jgi:acetoin:2,6-dichlorophenolindophenol oxidoreductase subunit beta